MPNPAKVQEVQEIQEKLQRAKGVVLTEFKGMTVAQVTQFRRDLQKDGLEFKVVKNTLLGLAAAHAGIEGLGPYLSGPTAILIGYEDAVLAAKAAQTFAKANKELTTKAGVLEGRVIGEDAVKALANLPSREVLLGQVVWGMASPLFAMASVLQAPIRNLGYGLTALLKERQLAA